MRKLAFWWTVGYVRYDVFTIYDANSDTGSIKLTPIDTHNMETSWLHKLRKQIALMKNFEYQTVLMKLSYV